MEKLTPRQQQILDYIRNTQQERNHSPSLREIAEHFSFRSVNAAREHVNALTRKGHLSRNPGQARSLELLDPLGKLRARIVDIPLFGSIPAGFATGEVEEAQGCISVDVATLGVKPGTRTFALQVRGDSMIGRNICDGDYVICEHGLTPRRNDIVAALIDNENTLKTFVRENGRPYLKAENPKYPALIPATELVIQGVVISLIRKFD